MVVLNSEQKIRLDTLKQNQGVEFPLGAILNIFVDGIFGSESNNVNIHITLATQPFGDINLTLKDKISLPTPALHDIPRSIENDLHPDMVQARQNYVSEITGVTPTNLFNIDVDLDSFRGNIEHFCGVAQVPVGIAGPIKVNGELATGEILIPMATTEGTLVASYKRGMKLLNKSGGVKATVVDDAMQRAPFFVFNDARKASDFGRWVADNIVEIRRQAEATDPFLKLSNIEQYKSKKFVFLRFNFTTGGAAEHNIFERATYVACIWILEHYADTKNAEIKKFF